MRAKTRDFALFALYFGGLPRGANNKMSRQSYFKLNRHAVSLGANQTFSKLLFIFLGKTFRILNFVSEFKIWNAISYCLLHFQQQWKSKNDCLSVELQYLVTTSEETLRQFHLLSNFATFSHVFLSLIRTKSPPSLFNAVLI